MGPKVKNYDRQTVNRHISPRNNMFRLTSIIWLKEPIQFPLQVRLRSNRQSEPHRIDDKVH